MDSQAEAKVWDQEALTKAFTDLKAFTSRNYDLEVRCSTDGSAFKVFAVMPTPPMLVHGNLIKKDGKIVGIEVENANGDYKLLDIKTGRFGSIEASAFRECLKKVEVPEPPQSTP